MKRKLLSLALAAAMLFCAGASFTACSSSDTTSSDTIKVGLVTDTGGVNDASFNESAWAGLQLAAQELGITVNYLESQTDADYSINIETFVDEDYDLIICAGYLLANATYEAAVAYPDQNFAIVDDTTCADLPNVACLMFEAAQASYLVGYIAGLETESDTVGFVLGMASTMMHEFGYGYVAGVLDANPDATITMANANAFADPAQGKSLSVAMITEGADVLYHAAGGTGLGVIEAAAEAGIKAIGVDSDQSALAPDTVITSALKRVDNASYDIAKSVLEGTFSGGVITYDITTAGVDITTDSGLISDETLAAVEAVKEQIIAGELVVPKDQASFEAIYGADVYTLD